MNTIRLINHNKGIFMNRLVFLPLLGLSLTLSAQSVQSITEKHMGAMLEDIKAYIAEYPEAGDLAAAYQSGIQAAYVTGQNDEVISLLSMQFDSLLANENAPEQQVIQTGMMLAQFAQQHGSSAETQKVKEVFEDRAEANPDSSYAQVAQALASMAAKPGIGAVPELSGTTLDGTEISLEDFRGKVVLLDFWATWCPPCVEGLPEIKQVYEKYHEQGFEIIGISLDQNIEPLNEFIAEENLAWVNLFDADQESSLADQFSITSIPSLFLLDQEGTIVALDPRGPGVLEAEVAKLLKD
jgi:thiol-disulfide isomerase/thioredoxin